MKKLIILLLLFSISNAGLLSKKAAVIKQEVAWSFIKEVFHPAFVVRSGCIENGDSFTTVLGKATINIDKGFDIKTGFSENFVSARGSVPFKIAGVNHHSFRYDLGLFWHGHNWGVGLWWSNRWAIAGHTVSPIDGEFIGNRNYIEIRWTL